MKLSEIKGERVFDVVADLIDPIANIAEDEVASSLFKREKCPKGMSAREFVMSKVRKSVPVLLKDHKRDLAAIMAAIKGVGVDEYIAGLSMPTLISDIAELLDDEDFKAFLS